MPNAYEINGTGIPLDPEDAYWLPRDIEGIDGNGRAIYSSVREFRFHWGLLTPAQVWQLQEWWQAIGATGTVTVALPHYAFPTFTFFTYTGVLVQEPVIEGAFFTEDYQDVTLLVTNIRTQDV